VLPNEAISPVKQGFTVKLEKLRGVVWHDPEWSWPGWRCDFYGIYSLDYVDLI